MFFRISLLIFCIQFIDAKDNSSDILFLKIQQLEDEIASLRSELESQAYLIDQLSNNNEDVTENNESSNQFTQIDDKIKIDGIYDQAIQSLNKQDYADAKEKFNFIYKNFSNSEKIPLSLFWIAEISLSETNIKEAEKNLMLLIRLYPNHWRTPLAHKKVGDIFLAQGNKKLAREKYKYVVNSFPDDNAASLALQLLENME